MSILGTFYGDTENQILEFKEFYLKLHPDTYLDEEDIYKIIKEGIWHDKLNQIILDNINFYLKVYIPKYVSCYFNSNNNGKLIIGIDDVGEITGIPYNGDLNVDTIKEYIIKNISQYITGIESINSAINVSLIKLDVLIELLENPVDGRIQLMHDKFALYKKTIDSYKEAKYNWIKKISKYCVKIHKVLNHPQLRKELIEFVKKNGGNQTIVDLLETDKEITVKLNDEFYERMKDKNDIVYWATSFKDYHIEIIQTIRPEKDILPSLINSSIILSKISDMRHKFITANKDINYYLIVIDILGKKNNKEAVYFKLPNSDTWYSRTRIESEYGPGCI